MSFVIRKAARKFRFLKVGIGGVAGSGKTMGALKMAYGITGDWSKICVIDSENNSADLYAHLGPFDVCPLAETSPRDYIQAISVVSAANRYKVMIIDSISHEWAGRSGVLEMVGDITQSSASGNSYAAWKQGTPIHNQFIDSWLRADIHAIVTMRAKDDYILTEGGNGKLAPKKVGLKNIQRDGTDFELDVLFRVERNHRAHVEKHRTNLFSPEDFFELTEDTGKKLIAWASSNDGHEAAPKIVSVAYAGSDDDKRRLKDLFDTHDIKDIENMKKLALEFNLKPWTEIETVLKNLQLTAKTLKGEL
jgi:hypothetical protein